MANFIAEQLTFYIAHNNTDVFHYGIIQSGRSLSTGQPNLETFVVLQDWADRLIVLGIDPTIVNEASQSQATQQEVITEQQQIIVAQQQSLIEAEDLSTSILS